MTMAHPRIAPEAAQRIREGLARGERRDVVARAAGVSTSTVWRFQAARHPMSPGWEPQQRYRRLGRVASEHRDGTITIRVRKSTLERILNHAELLLPGS